jgi:hypothetical protein
VNRALQRWRALLRTLARVRGPRGRDVGEELVDELEALLARAGGLTFELEPFPVLAREPATGTRLQQYANELRHLCQRVLEEADEETARAFWQFLIETAARHGRRAGGWPA